MQNADTEVKSVEDRVTCQQNAEEHKPQYVQVHGDYPFPFVGGCGGSSSAAVSEAPPVPARRPATPSNALGDVAAENSLDGFIGPCLILLSKTYTQTANSMT